MSMSDSAKAKARMDRLTERYNREYREGKWSTNRRLAGQCEDAYDEWVEACLREKVTA
jgi:hypothetical protein